MAFLYKKANRKANRLKQGVIGRANMHQTGWADTAGKQNLSLATTSQQQGPPQSTLGIDPSAPPNLLLHSWLVPLLALTKES